MNSKRPLVIVGALPKLIREEVVQKLLKLQAPVIAEAISGLREEPRLQHLIVERPPYQPDALVRVGGIPTAKIWRDLEVNPIPVVPLEALEGPFGFTTNPLKEPQDHLFHALSTWIPEGSLIYLGNSTPIRLWDRYATRKPRGFEVVASRGLNGIDGQIATFLGRAEPNRDNFAIVGDLTLLYDLAAFWILKQMEEISVNVIVINNGGGQIFKPKFSQKIFLNEHALQFEQIAKFWGLSYEKWTSVPALYFPSNHRLIEIIEPSTSDTFARDPSQEGALRQGGESVSEPLGTSCAL